MGAVEKRKPATNTGPTKQLPDKQLLRTLEHFVEVLESEKLVFSHNLGVHSGTAVIEDLVARKLWELCNRAHTLITMKDKCMEVFLSFCERLTAEKRNRMLTAFSVFDKEDLLDYVQLVRPHLVKDAITAPISPTGVNYGAILASAPGPSSIAAGNSNRPGVQVFKKSAPFVSRVEALRKAGHPFLKIVDRIIEDKHAETEAKRDPDIEDILLALKQGTVNDVVATQVHIMLRSNLTARKKWLAGMPLQQALLESSSSPRSPRSMPTPRTPMAPTICEDREHNHAEYLVV